MFQVSVRWSHCPKQQAVPPEPLESVCPLLVSFQDPFTTEGLFGHSCKAEEYRSSPGREVRTVGYRTILLKQWATKPESPSQEPKRFLEFYIAEDFSFVEAGYNLSNSGSLCRIARSGSRRAQVASLKPVSQALRNASIASGFFSSRQKVQAAL